MCSFQLQGLFKLSIIAKNCFHFPAQSSYASTPLVQTKTQRLYHSSTTLSTCPRSLSRARQHCSTSSWPPLYLVIWYIIESQLYPAQLSQFYEWIFNPISALFNIVLLISSWHLKKSYLCLFCSPSSVDCEPTPADCLLLARHGRHDLWTGFWVLQWIWHGVWNNEGQQDQEPDHWRRADQRRNLCGLENLGEALRQRLQPGFWAREVMSLLSLSNFV